MESLYNNEGKFDFQAWSNDIIKWMKNKEILNFDMRVSITGGRIQLNTKIDDNRYKKAVSSLTMKILNGAMQWIALAYNFQVREEDKKEEKERFSKEFNDKVEVLLNTFLESGLDTFFDLLDSYKGIYRMQYELQHLKYENGNWYRWNGDVWTGSGWIDDTGMVYNDSYGEMFQGLLPAEAVKNENVA